MRPSKPANLLANVGVEPAHVQASGAHWALAYRPDRWQLALARLFPMIVGVKQ